MDKLLLRHRNGDEFIALCRHFTKARANHDKQVGILHPLDKPGTDRGPHFARIKGMRIVEHILTAEGCGNRQRHIFGKLAQVAHGILCPATAADDHQRTLCLFDQRPHCLQLFATRMHGHLLIGRRIADRRIGRQHVFRQGDHHRTGTPVHRAMECLAHQFGNARGIVNLHDPFGHLAEHAAIIDFLKCLTLDLIACDLTDEEQHGRRILKSRVHANRCIGGAGAARDEANAGLTRQFAIGLCHIGCPALLPADNQVDGVACIVKGVERSEIAFAGHAEDPVRAMDAQRIHQNLASGTDIWFARHDMHFLNLTISGSPCSRRYVFSSMLFSQSSMGDMNIASGANTD